MKAFLTHPAWLGFLSGYWLCRFLDGPDWGWTPLWLRAVLAVGCAFCAVTVARESK